MARKYVSINGIQYEKIKTLIEDGHKYIAWEPKKFNMTGSPQYVYDYINLKMDGMNFNKVDINNPIELVKAINREFRCFIVPTGFPSKDPALSLKHIKLTITGSV